jgi:hypothetical protein
MIKRTKLPNPESHKKFIVSFCDKGNITVTFIKGLRVPSAGIDIRGRARLLLREPIATDLASPELWDWDAHHEASHLLPEHRFVYTAVGMCKTKLEESVLNVLADNMCERTRLGMFLGHDRILYKGRYKYLVDNMATVFNRKHPSISALYILDFEDRRKWQGSFPLGKVMAGGEEYLKVLKPMRIFQQLPYIMESEDAEQLYGLVLDIINTIKDAEPDEPEPEECDDSGDDSSDDGSSEETGDSDQDQEGGEEDSPENQHQESEDDDGEEGEPSSGPDSEGPGGEDESTEDVGGSPGDGDEQDTDNTEDSEESSEDGGDSNESGENPDDDGEEDNNPSRTKIYGEPPDDDTEDLPDNVQKLKKVGDYLDEGTDKQKYIPMGAPKFVSLSVATEGASKYQNIVSRLNIKSISKNVQKFFKVMARDSYQYGLRRGKIHGKNLHRLYTPVDESDPRIFKQKVTHRLKTDTAVSILMDCSGSMDWDNKYEIAAASVVMISKTLTDLRIPHEILGFTEPFRKLHIYAFKLFDENIKEDKLIGRLASSDVETVYTPDAEALVVAASRLFERTETNKLQIVLSDGQPEGWATDNGNDGEWYLKKVCEMIENSGAIDLVGIGICDSSVKKFYKNNVVINRPDDLEEVLIEALKKTLL